MHLINATALWICEKLQDIAATQNHSTTSNTMSATPDTILNATSISGEGISNSSETTDTMIVIGCIVAIPVIGCCLINNSRSGEFWARQEGRY